MRRLEAFVFFFIFYCCCFVVISFLQTDKVNVKPNEKPTFPRISKKEKKQT